MGGFSINLLLICFFTLLCKVFIRNPQKRNQVFLTIAFCQLLFLNFLRDYTVGQDTRPYLQAFEQISQNGLSSITSFEWEPGYVILNLIISKLGLNFRCLIIVIAAFSYYSIFRFINRYSYEKWLSVILFIVFGYYFATLHILRQTVALSIIILSYDTIVSRKLNKFIILVVLAAAFHFTAIFFIFTYFIFTNKHISILKFTAVFAVCFTLSKFLINYIINTAFRFVLRYEVYTDGSLGGEGYGMLILLVALTITGLLLQYPKQSHQNSFIIQLIVIATWLQTFTISFSLFARVCWYWNFALIAYIPLCIERAKNKNTKRALNLLVVTLALLFFYTYTNVSENKEEFATYKFME